MKYFYALFAKLVVTFMGYIDYFITYVGISRSFEVNDR